MESMIWNAQRFLLINSEKNFNLNFFLVQMNSLDILWIERTNSSIFTFSYCVDDKVLRYRFSRVWIFGVKSDARSTTFNKQMNLPVMVKRENSTIVQLHMHAPHIHTDSILSTQQTRARRTYTTSYWYTSEHTVRASWWNSGYWVSAHVRKREKESVWVF